MWIDSIKACIESPTIKHPLLLPLSLIRSGPGKHQPTRSNAAVQAPSAAQRDPRKCRPPNDTAVVRLLSSHARRAHRARCGKYSDYSSLQVVVRQYLPHCTVVTPTRPPWQLQLQVPTYLIHYCDRKLIPPYRPTYRPTAHILSRQQLLRSTPIPQHNNNFVLHPVLCKLLP